jgi:hypothetical protein
MGRQYVRNHEVKNEEVMIKVDEFIDWKRPSNTKAITITLARLGISGASHFFGITRTIVVGFLNRNDDLPRAPYNKPTAALLVDVAASIIADGGSLQLTTRGQTVAGKPVFTHSEDLGAQAEDALFRWAGVEGPKGRPKGRPKTNIPTMIKLPTPSTSPDSTDEQPTGLFQDNTTHVRDTADWGYDDTALQRLRENFPKAVHVLEARMMQCRTPLWDMSIVDGKIRSTQLSLGMNNENHRYVCGNHTDGVSSTCRTCFNLLAYPEIKRPPIALRSSALTGLRR